MATPIRIPGLGTAVDEVTLLKWLKNVGDEVKRGDFLCEIETDKAVVELESVAEGVLLVQTVTAGNPLSEGTLIAWIGVAGEEIPEEIPSKPEGEEKIQNSEAEQAPPVVNPASDKVKVPQLIRNLAKKLGVDLETVSGTGPGGRITKEDVERAKDSAG